MNNSKDNFEYTMNKMREYAVKEYIPILRPESCRILCDIVKSLKPKTTLEVGTAIGFSTALILNSFSSTKLTSIEINENRLKIAKENLTQMGLIENVSLILGDANEEVKHLNENFDFIFLDGPKSHYIKQLPYLLNHLNVGGVLLADNVLFMGEVMKDTMPSHKHRTAILKLRAFIKAIQENNTLESRLIEIEDGLIYAKKVK